MLSIDIASDLSVLRNDFHRECEVKYDEAFLEVEARCTRKLLHVQRQFEAVSQMLYIYIDLTAAAVYPFIHDSLYPSALRDNSFMHL